LTRLQGAACDIGAVERQPNDVDTFLVFIPMVIKYVFNHRFRRSVERLANRSTFLQKSASYKGNLNVSDFSDVLCGYAGDVYEVYLPFLKKK
jgi:hypothetical protein